MSTYVIVRQPIFDRHRGLLGFEIRFRDTEDGRSAFDQVFLSGKFDILRGDRPAFVACSRSQIVERVFLAANPSATILLVPNSAGADPEVVTAINELRSAGGAVALDGLREGDIPCDRLLDVADWVRIDVSGDSSHAVTTMYNRVALSAAKCIADQVTDSTHCDIALDLGFDGFQGMFFSRPEPLPSNDVPTSSITALRSLALARDDRVTDRELETTISADPVLAFQILRLVNSAAIGAVGVESIAQALRLIGRQAFLQWLSVAIAASRRSKTGVDQQLVRQAVERARFLEQMPGQGRDRGTLFLVGLFSLLDAVFRMPLTDIVARVSLSADAISALMDRTGPYAKALEFADAHSLGLFERASELAQEMGVSPQQLPELYANAVQWADVALNAQAMQTS